MSAICPNCSRKTGGSACQWCHYPLAQARPAPKKPVTVRCPNCARKTQEGADCQWCHFPLLKSGARRNGSKPKHEKSGRKVFGLFLLIITAVILGGSILVLAAG